MSVRLRPHHLLCLLTYAGKGYSAGFVANMDLVAGKVAAGEEIVIISGPDDICAPLAGTADCHCGNESVRVRDLAALKALSALLDRPLAPGAGLRLNADLLARLRAAFAKGVIRQACAGCEWHGLCSEIAANGFGAARLTI